jgi:phosphoglycerate-specific signal transduction histidine kinase
VAAKENTIAMHEAKERALAAQIESQKRVQKEAIKLQKRLSEYQTQPAKQAARAPAQTSFHHTAPAPQHAPSAPLYSYSHLNTPKHAAAPPYATSHVH